jgi:hypothetical protein
MIENVNCIINIVGLKQFVNDVKSWILDYCIVDYIGNIAFVSWKVWIIVDYGVYIFGIVVIILC